jgi:transposase InsO family protein
MSLRRTIVSIDTSTLNVSEFCRTHGISTSFFHRLRREYDPDHPESLEPKSRAPGEVANKTSIDIEEAIVATRKRLEDAGLDAGPDTIAFHLAELDGLPSRSTIWRILRDRGLIQAQPAKAPKRAGRSFTAERANDCWQLDDTSWDLADGTPAKILNVVDDHSRLLVASAALASCTGTAALSVVAAAAVVVGWPARFLSDNAGAFRNVLATALGHLGVGAGHSRPYHPQTNGKVERLHQTLKKWLDRQPRAGTLAELQAQLDMFRFIYNHQRPHKSLGRQFPAAVWVAAPKSGPASRPLATPTEVHSATVVAGRFHITQRYDITVGAAHNRQLGVAVLTGLDCHIFIDGHLIRQLTVDPTRRRQPLHPRPGRPTQLP